MEVTEFEIEGLLVIKPKIFYDKRGFFYEVYNKYHYSFFKNFSCVQENESKSKYGVLRGLHFQKKPYEQAKLVRVISGKVLDVAVDLRKSSKTYGKYKSIILSGRNKLQFFIPRGFAHGYVVLSRSAVFSYLVDNKYSSKHESGIIYDDKDLNIDWSLPKRDIIVSEKDSKLGLFNDN